MIFWFLKIALPLFIRVYYRRIHLSGLENIPKGHPVFIAANHPNSFLDGVMVSLLLRRSVHVLVRGDVFRKGWANFLLRNMYLLPIYRASDGDMRENKVRNDRLLDRCYRMFRRNGVVLIFSEAIARSEKRLRPVRKGTARMALDLESRADFDLGLYLVPAGINYTYFKGYRKELMISFGKPIRVKDFEEQYRQNESTAYNTLTEQVAEGITAQMVEIRDPDHDRLIETALKIQRSETAFPFLSFFNRTDKRLASEMAVANQLNISLAGEDESIKKMLMDYTSKLHEFNIDERSFRAVETSGFRLFLVLILAVPALIGYLVFGWAFIVGRRMTENLVKRKPEFFDSVLFGISFLFSFLEAAVLAVLLIVLFGWWGVAFWVGLILCGYSFLAWKSLIRTYQFKRRFKQFSGTSDKEARELLALRNKIMAALQINSRSGS